MRCSEGEGAVLDLARDIVLGRKAAVRCHETTDLAGVDGAPVSRNGQRDGRRAGVGGAARRLGRDVVRDDLAVGRAGDGGGGVLLGHGHARKAGGGDGDARARILDGRALRGQGRAKGRDRGGGLAHDISVGVRTGRVAPDAEHRTGRIVDRAVLSTRCLEAGILEPAGLGGTALPTGIAKDPIIIAVGVDQLEALRLQIRSGHGRIAGPAGGPIADDDVRIEGAAGGDVVEVDAVVERHRPHASILDHLGDITDIGDVEAVLASALKVAEPHGARGVLIVGILIRTHIEVLAALAGEIGDVLLEEGLRERDGGGVGHVDGPGRVVIGTIRTSQAGRRRQDRIHMPRRVDAGDDAQALGRGIGDDGVHLALRQLIGREVVIPFVARVDGGRNCAAFIGRPIDRQGHVIQQEAQTVVADCQLDVVEASGGGVVDDLLDALDAEILPAAVEEDDLHEVVLGAARVVLLRRKRRPRQQAEHHHQRQEQRKHFFLLRTHTHFLLASLVSFFPSWGRGVRCRGRRTVRPQPSFDMRLYYNREMSRCQCIWPKKPWPPTLFSDFAKKWPSLRKSPPAD